MTTDSKVTINGKFHAVGPSIATIHQYCPTVFFGEKKNKKKKLTIFSLEHIKFTFFSIEQRIFCFSNFLCIEKGKP